MQRSRSTVSGVNSGFDDNCPFGSGATHLLNTMSISTQASKLRVLISGAGIAGPCLAYWLSRTRLNTTITIVERSPVPRTTGQAVDIRGTAIAIIEKMRLKNAVRARSTTEEGTRIVGASGNTIAEFGKGDAFTAEYEILRADLCGLFLDATRELPNVRHVYGDYVTSLSQSETKAEVTFNSGSKDSFDLGVGADGSTSKIRAIILDEETRKGSYKPIGQYIAYFSIPRQPSDTKHWYWYNEPRGLGVMTRPHRNESTVGAYLCITLPAHGQSDPVLEEALSQGPEAQKRILNQYFAKAGWQTPRVLAGMNTSTDFYMSRAARVVLPRWHSNRTVLLGDAAFATFGIGTSLAIQSAYTLAGELSTITGSDQVPAALERYEDAFRKVTGVNEELPPGFPQLAFPQSAWGIRVRDAAAWFVGKTKAYKLLPGENRAGKDKLTEYEWVGA